MQKYDLYLKKRKKTPKNLASSKNIANLAHKIIVSFE